MTDLSYPDLKLVLNKLIPEVTFEKDVAPKFGIEWWCTSEKTYNNKVVVYDYVEAHGALHYRYVVNSNNLMHDWPVEEGYCSVLNLSWRLVYSKWIPFFGVLETDYVEESRLNGRLPRRSSNVYS